MGWQAGSSPFKARTQGLKRGGGFAASEGQRRKVAGDFCCVCWQAPADPAHLIPRSVSPDHSGDPLRVVPLCRRCHDAYDGGRLDLLPHLDGFDREVAMAVECVGLVAALERITNRKWGPK